MRTESSDGPEVHGFYMDTSFLSALLLIQLFLLLLTGMPVALALGATGTLGFFILQGFTGLGALSAATYWAGFNFILTALPLFILMGNLMFRAGIGAELYYVVNRWFGHVPGGLGVASVGACTVFGAMCGVSSAGVATVGVSAVPEMRKYKYNLRLSVGAVATAGALAMLIPPSIAMLVYGPIAGVSVDRLFMAGVLPGIMISVLFAGLFVVIGFLRPDIVPRGERYSWWERLAALRRIWSPLVIIGAVLGGIYMGIATPTEVAAVGALATLVIGAIWYKLRMAAVMIAVRDTVVTTGMIMLIVIGATLFGRVMVRLGVSRQLAEAAGMMPVEPVVVLLMIVFALIVLGCFLDGLSLLTVTTPILLPTVTALGFDPIWYGVVLIIALEVGLVTPPLGLNLFITKSIVPDVSLTDVFIGCIPFVLLMFVAIGALVIFPEIALWLPDQMR